MAKWIVTGAAGFIASNLSYELVRQGHIVLGLEPAPEDESTNNPT
jgi:nucleoside-diphosphate-sugar epimerase